MGGFRAETGTPNRQRKRARRTPGTGVPRLERVAPDEALPRVGIDWTKRELKRLAEMASAEEANPPTDALIRALQD
jgi:hypothetical protein